MVRLIACLELVFYARAQSRGWQLIRLKRRRRVAVLERRSKFKTYPHINRLEWLKSLILFSQYKKKFLYVLNNYNDIGILFVCTFYYSVLTKLVHWWGVHEFSKSDYVIGTSNAGAYEKGNWINCIYYKKKIV